VIGFLAIAALLAAAALAFLLPPLLRGRGSSATTSGEVNAAIYREQLGELRLERDRGAITAAEFDHARRELEQRVVAEASVAAQLAPPSRSPRAAALAIALFMPLAVALGYWQLGNPGALDATPASPADAMAKLTPDQVRELTEKLWERMHASPEDPKGWTLLARSLAALGDHDRAAQAYARAATLVPKDAGLLADYAEALAMARGMKLDGEPYALAKRALELEPEHLKALALAGSAEFDRGAYAEAIGYWARALKQLPPESELARTVTASIAEAQRLTAAPAAPVAAIKGVVSIDPALSARAAPGDTVFVLARPAGGSRMPLAVARTTVRELPYSFTLDDSMAMAPGAKLSGHPQIVVVARISKSGKASPEKGDIEGASQVVAPGASDVKVVLSRVLE
jgi:cytochrome c-type biogenesis protein CcmH